MLTPLPGSIVVELGRLVPSVRERSWLNPNHPPPAGISIQPTAPTRDRARTHNGDAVAGHPIHSHTEDVGRPESRGDTPDRSGAAYVRAGCVRSCPFSLVWPSTF